MKKLLIVESLAALREQQKKVLSNRSLQLFTAATAEEALSLHRAEKVDLIVARLDIPGMGGDSLCTAIRKDDSLKKVSFIMACDNTKLHLERCQMCGANSYVLRPVDPEVLLEKVGRLIDIPRRTGIRVLIKVSVKGDVGNQPFFCSSVNISTAGILLEVDKVAAVGKRLTCAFFIPGSANITAEGEIMRVVDVSPSIHHWGVRFLDLPADHKSAIEAFVKKKT